MSIIDIASLKRYIFENDKVEFILEQLGCGHIKRKHSYDCEYITCSNSDGDNQTAINVYLSEYLNTINHTRDIKFEKDDKTDFLHLVTYILKLKNNSNKLKDAIVYLHKLLGLPLDYNHKDKKKDEESDKPHPLDIFRKIKKRKKIKIELELRDEDEVLRNIVQMPHISLIREGILPHTCNEFNVGYSPEQRRITFCERYWAGDKKTYLGVMGRTIIPEYDMLGIPKYFPVGKSYDKGLNVYGLNENYEYIQSSGFVVVLESQKSVLRRHSRLDKTCVSIGNHTITAEQKRILISLDVDIVIALDKDVDINKVRAECEKFYNVRNVYYLFDKWGILKDKESPADLDDKVYKFMLQYKVKYDKIEHEEYLKYLKDNK